MFDFLPVFFEGIRGEVGVVVRVVAFGAVTTLGLRERVAHGRPTRLQLIGRDAGRIARELLLQADVAAARSVAVLALLMEQVRGAIGAQEAGVEPQHLLRLPAGDVARQALGIVNARDRVGVAFPSGDERGEGFGVRRGLPMFKRFGMALASLLGTDEGMARRMLE